MSSPTKRPAVETSMSLRTWALLGLLSGILRRLVLWFDLFSRLRLLWLFNHRRRITG